MAPCDWVHSASSRAFPICPFRCASTRRTSSIRDPRTPTAETRLDPFAVRCGPRVLFRIVQTETANILTPHLGSVVWMAMRGGGVDGGVGDVCAEEWSEVWGKNQLPQQLL